MEKYCILGIPHILLIDPAGIILAKNLRGEDIYNAVKKNIQPTKGFKTIIGKE